MLSYLFGTRPLNQAPAKQAIDAITELKAEINELREQITQLKHCQPENQPKHKEMNSAAIDANAGAIDANAGAIDANAGVQTLPTYAELVAQFGEFELHRHYYHNKSLNPQDEQEKYVSLQTLEKIYYFEYLKRVRAIREETQRTICDMYEDRYPEALNQWMAQNSMVPSSYFSGKVNIYYLLSKHCKDVEFIEANLSHMSPEGLRENPALNLSFFAKHKIYIEAPQIFSHDVSQEYCERALANMSNADFLRLAYNPRAPVAFMLANADKVNWRVASQFNGIALLNAAHAHVIPEMQKINLNLPSTPKCGRDLQYAMLNPLSRLDSLRDSQLVINYNCDWRQKLLNMEPGPFADWKKYIFYSGDSLNTKPYISTLAVDQSMPIEQQSDIIMWHRDNHTSESFNSNRIPASTLLYQPCKVDNLLC
jgi:hypothetical protein